MGASPSNLYEMRHRKEEVEVTQNIDKALHLEFGHIVKINDQHQVQVRLVNGTLLGEEMGNVYYPLLNPIDDVELRWGPLRPGLFVRVWWRGENLINALIEVLGNENFNPLEQKPTIEPQVGVYKILSPGLGF